MSTVTSITPNLGAVGDSVTITGTGFGASRGGSTVTFGGVAVASYTSWGDTSIVVVVPAATPSGRVVVTVSGTVQTDYKASWFEIRDSSCLSLYDAINGRLKLQDETNDSSPEDYRAADARDYNNALQLLANILEGPGKSFMNGLRVRYSSATAVIVEAGGAMSSTGKHALTLAAESTLSITTAAAALGLDETALSGQFVTTGGTGCTSDVSLYDETPLVNTVRTLTGTTTSVGTALTGTSTKFLTECAIGDVVRSSANGASRITAIASDTAATLVAAFPGGDVTGVAATLYENLTLWPDTAQSGDKRAVNTVTHNGKTMVLSSATTSNGSGKAGRVGVEIASRWFYPWLVYGSSGTTAILSTQRTRPYGVAGYTTAWRRIPCAVYNNSSGDISNFEDRMGGPLRLILWDASGDHPCLGGGSATSWTQVDTSVGCPPTAATLIAKAAIFNATFASTAGYLILQMRSNASAAGPNGEVGTTAGTTAATAGTNYSSGCPLAMSSAGGFDYQFVAGGTGAISASAGYIDALGWWEEAA